MSPRVAPRPASSGCAGFASTGCPASAFSGDSGGESPRVASPRPPFSCAGDGSSGYPASRILQRCRQVIPRVAPVPHSSCFASRCFRQVAPASASSGFSGDGSSGLPRISHPSALPVNDSPGCPGSSLLSLASQRFHRVAPASAPSGSAGDGASGCPLSRILQRRCWRFSGLPRILARQPRLLMLPPGCPGFRIFRLCQR